MEIDNNPIEINAMDAFRRGETKEAHRLQDSFLDAFHKGLEQGEDFCSCIADCKHHGHCMDCVVLHRGHGDHLPECMRDIVNRKLLSFSELTEHSVKNLLPAE